MIDKKEAKSAYKLQEKLGAVVAYKNISKNVYIIIYIMLKWIKNKNDNNKPKSIDIRNNIYI